MRRRPPVFPDDVSATGRSVRIPASFGAFHLARTYHQQGRLPEAERFYKAQLKDTPDHFDTLHLLALVKLQRGGLSEASRLLRKALTRHEGSAGAHNTLGYVLQSQGHLEEAAGAYRRAIAMDPNYAAAYNNLGTCLLGSKRLDEAVEQFRLAVAKKPDFADAYKNLGGALLGLDRVDEAVAFGEKALSIQPDLASAHFHNGVALEAVGRLVEARSSLEMAVKLAPKSGRFHQSLAEIKRYEAGDAHLAEMQALAGDMASLPEEEQMFLHFALGKALMDIGEHGRAFRHLLEGNALKRRHVQYNEQKSLSSLDRVRSVFTPKFMRSYEGEGVGSELPIFVLGMPRSGTTLIEQILASHPDVHGGGERPDFENALTSICTSKSNDIAAYPDCIRTLTKSKLQELGSRYLTSLRKIAPGASRITDKLPDNFRLVGLIHLALPNARIIHVRRDPIDTCLSCFTKVFSGELSYTYSLEELGRYYQAYRKLMAYWREVLPGEAMLEVDYEAVVADIEGQARRLVAYCGLVWNDRCVDFHRTKRPIRTASAAQVRQPIYSSSVGRWRPYRDLLGPLFEVLEIDASQSHGI